MTIYIALLRGINVGGNKKIRMADLKRVLEAIGCMRVQTYIQSGNVLFESPEREETLLGRIEREIEQAFGFKVDVTLRTAAEWARIIADNPFDEDRSAEKETLHVVMLFAEPSREDIERLRALSNENEQFRIAGREVYLLLRQGVRDSKLAAAVQKLSVPGTARNWRTMNKLAAMAEAMRVE